uniref:Uncharacterized protein n=1 Tax=Timema poppense TaxID=170557 RepID=A0A7R9DEN7_TIMPO|nr:unnamed protein product [Timema poppensis]
MGSSNTTQREVLLPNLSEQCDVIRLVRLMPTGIYFLSSLNNSPMASLVLTDSSQLTSDSQHLDNAVLWTETLLDDHTFFLLGSLEKEMSLDIPLQSTHLFTFLPDEEPCSWSKGLTSHFTSLTILVDVHAEFYGREQQQTEMVETFLRHKVRLSQRLNPASAVDNLIPLLIELQRHGQPRLRKPHLSLCLRDATTAQDVTFIATTSFWVSDADIGETRETVGRRINQPHLWPRDRKATTNDSQRQSSNRQDPTAGPLRDLRVNAPHPTRHWSYLQFNYFIHPKHLPSHEHRALSPFSNPIHLAKVGSTLTTQGQVQLTVTMQSLTLNITCPVSKALRESLILGQPWFTKIKAIMDYEYQRVLLWAQERYTLSWSTKLYEQADPILGGDIQHHAPLEYQDRLLQLLDRHRDLFTTQGPLRRTCSITHRIQLRTTGESWSDPTGTPPQNMNKLTSPHTTLLRNKVRCRWTPDLYTNFLDLQMAFTQLKQLKLPDTSKPFPQQPNEEHTGEEVQDWAHLITPPGYEPTKVNQKPSKPLRLRQNHFMKSSRTTSDTTQKSKNWINCRKMLNTRNQKHHLEDDVLWHRETKDDPWKLVIPKTTRQWVQWTYHDDHHASHPGEGEIHAPSNEATHGKTSGRKYNATSTVVCYAPVRRQGAIKVLNLYDPANLADRGRSTKSSGPSSSKCSHVEGTQDTSCQKMNPNSSAVHGPTHARNGTSTPGPLRYTTHNLISPNKESCQTSGINLSRLMSYTPPHSPPHSHILFHQPLLPRIAHGTCSPNHNLLTQSHRLPPETPRYTPLPYSFFASVPYASQRDPQNEVSCEMTIYYVQRHPVVYGQSKKEYSNSYLMGLEFSKNSTNRLDTLPALEKV